MNRKLVWLLTVLLLASVHLAEAQQPAKTRRIGWLARRPEATLVAFRQGLRDLGYIEGQQVTIETRYAGDRDDRLLEFAAELVRLPVEVIIAAAGNPSVRAAKDATSTIPIIMGQSGVDPIAAGLIASLARPGGNVTGLTAISADLSGKRLEILKEAAPNISRVAVLWNATIPDKLHEVRQIQVAAKALGLPVQTMEVHRADDFETVFSAAIKRRPDALAVLQDSLTLSHGTQIMAFAIQNRLPTVCEFTEWTDVGCLIVYGPNRLDLFRRATFFVDKILKGAKPADLPVQQPTKFELVINLKTAKQLAIAIPPNLLGRADKVIK